MREWSDVDDFDDAIDGRPQSDECAVDPREVEAINEGGQAMERGEVMLLRKFDLEFRNRNGVPLS
jgi:hypothetical protein